MLDTMAANERISMDCAVCLDKWYSPTACVPCGHVFCYACINKWRQARGRSAKCPECRMDIGYLQQLWIGEGSANHQAWKSSRFYNEQAHLVNNLQALSVMIQRAAFHVVSQFRRIPHPADCMRIGRRYLDAVKQYWHGLGRDLQILTVFVATLVISLVVKDVNNPHGLVNSCFTPIFSCLSEIGEEFLRIFLLLLCRPIVCMGQCLVEIISASGDVIIAMTMCLTIIAKNVVLIPYVIVTAVLCWLSPLIMFFWGMFVLSVRLTFVVLFILVPSFFFFATEEQHDRFRRIVMDRVIHFIRQFEVYRVRANARLQDVQ